MEDAIVPPQPGQTASGNQGQYGENGRPITDYCAKYDLTQSQVDKMVERFKNGKDFVQPSADYEREFVTDCIIE